VNQNDNQSHEVLQEWRDENGNVDLNAVRSGMVDIRHQDAIWSALLDEVESLRQARESERDKLARYVHEFANEIQSGRVEIGEIPHVSLYHTVGAEEFGGHEGALAEVERIARELGGKVSHKPYQETVQHSAYVVWGNEYGTRVEYHATYIEQVEGGAS
jgi:hypothetical protein